ncbi:MAG: amino acid decarboxylase [Anaerolineae bacterium]|nr:amino acid decarboxylase [Anaerolineae bacterium]
MTEQSEHTLDPQNWEEFRQLGHQMMDDMLDYLQTLREKPVWQPIPDDVKNHFKESLPMSGSSETAVYEDFKQTILPYPLGNTHPRFWGWVIGTGTPLGMLAELLTGAISAQVGGAEHIGTYVELQVLNWLKEIMGFPADASGILISGASMANFVGLTVARNTKAPVDIRKVGLQGDLPRMVLYTSVEAHSCHQKNAEVLGLGRDSIRFIPVDENYQIKLDALRQAIEADKAAGYLPFCVIGSAGTVKTGAYDDLNALADLCAEHNLWLHIDGAFGALVAFTEQSKYLINGMERADSLAFDMHKWMSLPFEAACVLVKSRAAHYNTFTLTPDYLAHGDRGASGAKVWLTDYGLQLSRSFRALKVWMALKTHGVEQIGNSIQMNIEQTQYLVSLIERSPELECTAPAPLNIVCFRYVQSGLSPEALDALNKELLLRLHESGVALVSNATINGQYCLRMANVNHRSSYADFDMLVEKVVELGRALAVAQS